jgi:hypothetical protein
MESMITSNQILSLSEIYADSININGTSVNIYVNPTYDDVKEIFNNRGKDNSWTGDVRTIIDAKAQKVYVWNAYLSIHVPVIQFLGYDRGAAQGKFPYLITGYANITSNRLVLSSSHQKTMFSFITRPEDVRTLPPTYKERVDAEKFLKEFFSYNWLFADKYLQGFKVAFNWFKSACEK